MLPLCDALHAGWPPRLELDRGGRPVSAALVLDASRPVPSGDIPRLAQTLRDTSRIVVVAGAPAPPIAAAADVVFACRGCDVANAVETDDPFAAAIELSDQIDESALAAVALVWLLRQTEHSSVSDALVAESAVYSMLLGSTDFRRWLRSRRSRRAAGDTDRIRVVRDRDDLRITLARPQRRNAIDAMMRDALLAALEVARWDTGVHVTIDADGPSFCAGGDLDEFGSARDPAGAHVVRVAGGLGRVLWSMRNRVTVRVHGACVGAGVELPAFVGKIIAAPGAHFRLPETAMGLIPGAGGTVSLPRRIGRSRTAWLALSGSTIDAPTALQWGLIDGIEP